MSCDFRFTFCLESCCFPCIPTRQMQRTITIKISSLVPEWYCCCANIYGCFECFIFSWLDHVTDEVQKESYSVWADSLYCANDCLYLCLVLFCRRLFVFVSCSVLSIIGCSFVIFRLAVALSVLFQLVASEYLFWKFRKRAIVSGLIAFTVLISLMIFSLYSDGSVWEDRPNTMFYAVEKVLIK
jgi:hypothetical protein